MNLDVVNTTLSHQLPVERLMLYAHYLEIGAGRGGSATIVSAAMDENLDGDIVCVDPMPERIEPSTWAALEKRAARVDGFSPQALGEVYRRWGAIFDFVLIDGDHHYDAALADAEGVVRLLAPRAYLLFHDALHPDVTAAISAFLKRHQHHLTDAGLVSSWSKFDGIVRWGGLRLLRWEWR
jgi:predicted O-methyltransferase YrrM